MASNTQQEYNRLRAELDKFKRENRTAGGQAFGAAHAAYSKKVSGLQKQIDALKPTLAKQTYPITQRGPQRTPAQVAASLEYSDDPNSPFQKALARIESDTQAKKIEDSKKKEISDLESGYLSDKKTKEDSLRSKEKKAKDATKAAEEAAQLKVDNAILVKEGKTPKPTPPSEPQAGTTSATDAKAKADLIAKNQAAYNTAQAEKEMLSWSNMVQMSSGKKVTVGRPGSPSSITVPDRMLAVDAKKLFLTDKKIQDKVMQTLKNSGQKNVSQEEAYMTWVGAVQSAADYALQGKGYIVTPMELINMRNKPKDTGPVTSTNKSMVEYTSAQLGDIVDAIFQENLGKNPSAAQRERYILQFQKGVAQGNVTTTVTNGRNSTTSTKRGFDADRAAADLGAKLQSSSEFATPYKQKQALEFDDAITRLMQGGL